MSEPRIKWLHVGGARYVIFDKTETLDGIVEKIKTAVAEKGLAAVPVLDDNRNQMTLYINGAQVEAFAIDTGLGPPKPGEFAP